MVAQKYDRWTPEDIEVLKRLYTDGGLSACFKHFTGRTSSGTESKIRQLRRNGEMPSVPRRECNVQRDRNNAIRALMKEEAEFDDGLPQVKIVRAEDVQVDLKGPIVSSVFDIAHAGIDIKVQDRDTTDLRQPRFRYERYDTD